MTPSFIGEALWQLRQWNGLARERVRAVRAEIQDACRQNVVTDEGRRLAAGVSHPFPGPFSANFHRLHALVLKARAKRRSLKVAIELPSIGQSVHLTATWTPVYESARHAAEPAADLVHFAFRGVNYVISKRKGPTATAGP